MQFKVRLFLDNRYIEPSAYGAIQIRCPTVDRIVNHIYELAHGDGGQTGPPGKESAGKMSGPPQTGPKTARYRGPYPLQRAESYSQTPPFGGG